MNDATTVLLDAARRILPHGYAIVEKPDTCGCTACDIGHEPTNTNNGYIHFGGLGSRARCTNLKYNR